MLITLLATAHALDLAVDPVVRDEDVALRVTGATPGDAVVVLYGGRGRGPCPPVLGGLCLQVDGPRVVARGVADATGAVDLVAHVPATLPLVDLALQAAVTSPVPAVSAVVVRTVVVDVGPGPTAVIAGPIAWRAFRHVRDTARDVVVTYTPGDLVVLPHLRHAPGLRFEGTGVREVRLPALLDTSVGACGTPTLAFVGNAALEAVTAPAWTTGSLCSEGNGPVAYDLPAWTTGGVLSLTSTGRQAGPPTDAAAIDAPLLAELDGLDVYWTQLTGLALPSLAVVDGPIQVWHDALLASLDLPALVSAPVLAVVDDPVLSICDVEAIVDRAALGAVVCHDDSYDDTCADACGP